MDVMRLCGLRQDYSYRLHTSLRHFVVQIAKLTELSDICLLVQSLHKVNKPCPVMPVYGFK